MIGNRYFSINLHRLSYFLTQKINRLPTVLTGYNTCYIKAETDYHSLWNLEIFHNKTNSRSLIFVIFNFNTFLKTDLFNDIKILKNI